MHGNPPPPALLRNHVADMDRAGNVTLRAEHHGPIEAGNLAGAQAGLAESRIVARSRAGNEERETRRSMRFSIGGVITLACLPGIGIVS